MGPRAVCRVPGAGPAAGRGSAPLRRPAPPGERRRRADGATPARVQARVATGALARGPGAERDYRTEISSCVSSRGTRESGPRRSRHAPATRTPAARGESCRASRAAPRAPLDAPTREVSALHTRAQAPSAPRPSRWRRITVRKYAPRHQYQSVYRPVCSAATQGAMRVSPLDKALEAPHVWARASCSSGPVSRDRLPRGRQTRPELLRVMLALWVVRSPDRCPASPQRQRLRACCQS